MEENGRVLAAAILALALLSAAPGGGQPADEKPVDRAAAARALHDARVVAEDAWAHLASGEKDWGARSVEAAAALLDRADRFEKAEDALTSTLLGPGFPPAVADRHSAFLAAHRTRRLELERATEGLTGSDPAAAAKAALAVLSDAAALPPRDAIRSIQVRHVKRIVPRAEGARFSDLDDTRLGPLPSPQDSAVPGPALVAAARAVPAGKSPETVAADLRATLDIAVFHAEALGPAGCLRDRRCSAFDASLLLVALLRGRGVPARLAYGTVEAEGTAIAARILGGGSALEALDALHLGGVPAEVHPSDPRLLRFEHVWVRAHVAGAWIDLDPSFDPRARPVPAATAAAARPATDAAALLARYLTATTDRTPYGADLLPAPRRVPAPAPGPKGKSKKPDPKAAPARAWAIVVRGGEMASAPLAYRGMVALTAGGRSDAAPLVDVRIPLADVMATGILIYPAPPSELERRIAKALAGKRAAGGDASVPPHLTTATTLLSAGGREIAALPPMPWGAPLPLTLTLIPPNGDPVDVLAVTQTGAPAALTVAPFEPGGGWLPSRWQLADEKPTGAAGLASACAATGAQFFADLLDETGRLAARAGGRRFVSPSAVLVAGSLYAPTGLARAPLFAEPAGLVVDVGRLDETLLPTPGADAVAFEAAAGAALSAWEGRALEIATGYRAASTVSAAKAAAAEGSAPRVLRGRARASDLAGLSPPAREEIRLAMEAGMVVVLPRLPQALAGWSGESYVLVDPRSGRGAWLIRGGLRGAVTADRAAVLLESIRDGGDAGAVLAGWRRGRAGRALLAREGWPAGTANAKGAGGVGALLAAAAAREGVAVPEIGPWPPAGGRVTALEMGEPIAARVGTLLWMGRGSRVLDPAAALLLGKNPPTGYDPKTRLWIGPSALGIVDGRLLPVPARY